MSHVKSQSNPDKPIPEGLTGKRALHTRCFGMALWPRPANLRYYSNHQLSHDTGASRRGESTQGILIYLTEGYPDHFLKKKKNPARQSKSVDATAQPTNWWPSSRAHANVNLTLDIKKQNDPFFPLLRADPREWQEFVYTYALTPKNVSHTYFLCTGRYFARLVRSPSSTTRKLKPCCRCRCCWWWCSSKMH